jgi:hypothetical protein
MFISRLHLQSLDGRVLKPDAIRILAPAEELTCLRSLSGLSIYGGDDV